MADPPSNSAHPPSTDPFKTLDNFFIIMVDVLTLACFWVFSVLIGLDGWRAFSKRANWFPGKAFALTGVTVQILVWWTSFRNIAFYDMQIKDRVVLYQLVVNGRVALCVFIGYLLPTMGAPHFRYFGTLAIGVCAQIGSEFLNLRASRHHPELAEGISWGKLIDPILFITIIVLGLILGCTVLAGTTVRGLLKERISGVFSTDKEEESTDVGNEKTVATFSDDKEKESTDVGNERKVSASWDDFEDESFKSWLVARVCQVDYVLSRSVLSSAVGIVVTIPVVLFILTNTYHNELAHTVTFDVFVTSPVASFILVGWIVICWRFLAAPPFFPPEKCTLKRILCVEDFWTISIVRVIHMYDLKGDRQRSSLLTKIFTKLRFHKLLYLLLMLQVTVIFFSKICGLFSEVITCKFMYGCYKCLKKGDEVALEKKYEKLLESICMPGENPSDLWQANKRSIARIRRLMKDGKEKVRECNQINSKFQHYSLQWAVDGTKLLHDLKKNALPSVLKHFPNVEKRPWKITVVSLISIIFQLQRANVDIGTKALNACHEVWNLLSFMDEADIDLQADGISLVDDFDKDTNEVAMAAEKEFYRLQIKYGEDSPSSQECDTRGSQECVTDVETARSILYNLSEKCKALLERENLLRKEQQNSHGKKFFEDLSDSRDWTQIALSYSLYKLCKIMEDDHVEDFVRWTDESLRNVIAACVSMLPDMLVKQCWKWAEGFEEDKLLEAIALSSKVRGIMEAQRLQPKLELNPTMTWKWTLHASNQAQSSASDSGDGSK